MPPIILSVPAPLWSFYTSSLWRSSLFHCTPFLVLVFPLFLFPSIIPSIITLKNLSLLQTMKFLWLGIQWEFRNLTSCFISTYIHMTQHTQLQKVTWYQINTVFWILIRVLLGIKCNKVQNGVFSIYILKISKQWYNRNLRD